MGSMRHRVDRGRLAKAKTSIQKYVSIKMLESGPNICLWVYMTTYFEIENNYDINIVY